MKKELIFKGLRALGFDRVFRVVNRDKTVVLMYHGVDEDHHQLAEGNWLQVTETEFLKQMVFLKEHYDVIPLSMIDKLEPQKRGKPRAVITFDDGYANNYRVAFPILKTLGLPATIFLVTAHIDTKHIFWYDKLWCACKDTFSPQKLQQLTESFKLLHPHEIDKAVNTELEILDSEDATTYYGDEHISHVYGILTSSQIEEMNESGLIEFGCHTHRHEILTKMPDHGVDDTLADSVYWGAHYLGINFSSFCAPNGNYDPLHIEMFKKHHFERSVTTKRGFYTSETNLFEIPRIGIGRGMSMEEFAVSLSGVQDAIVNLKKKVWK